MTWTIILTTHTDEYDKKFGDFISQNNRPFNKKKKLINSHRKHTTIEK